MAIPKKLRLFTLFVNGTNYLGKIPSVTLPKLTRKIEDYQGAGMIGAVGVDLGLEAGALDTTIESGGIIEEMLLLFGAEIDGVQMRFVGEYFNGETSSILEVAMRGRITEMDGGDSKQGEDTSATHAVKLTYYKLTIDGKDFIEIDLLNFVYKVNGKNLYPDRVMSALGMG
jgi:hypothetical protein